MKIKNILLGVSLFAFVIGFSDLQENIFFWMGRPIGAVFFILYFILMVLEKEYALMDEQNRATTAEREKKFRTVPSGQSSEKGTCAPALATAPR